MKLFIIAAAAATSMVGSVAFADVSSAAPSGVTFNLCAEEKRNGWVLSGGHAGFTDWATNQAIGQAIGDGNCQTWTMSTEIDNRVLEQLGMGSTNTVENTDTVVDVTVEKVDAGKLRLLNYFDDPYAAWHAAPVIINKDTGAKKKLVGVDNGVAKYKIVRAGNLPNGPAVGTVQNWDLGRWIQQNEMFRYPVSTDNSGDCWQTYNCHKARYWASRDITTTERTTTRSVTVVSVNVFCPATYDYIFSGPDGVVVVNEGEPKACNVKRTSRIVEVDVTSGTNVHTGDKYIDHDRLGWWNSN